MMDALSEKLSIFTRYKLLQQYTCKMIHTKKYDNQKKHIQPKFFKRVVDI